MTCSAAARRRLGEIIQLQKAMVGLNRGAEGIGKAPSAGLNPPHTFPPTLDDAGIDKNLAKAARKAAAIPEEEFEDVLADWRARVLAYDNRPLSRVKRRAPDVRTLGLVLMRYLPGQA